MTRRTHRLAIAALAILTAAALAACGSNTPDPQPSPTPPAAAPVHAHPDPTRDPTGGEGRHRDPGQRLRLHPQLDRQGRHLLPALRPGRAAHRQGRRRRLGRPRRRVPGPQRLLHPERQPRLREVVIGDQARVIGSQQLTGSPGPNPSSLKALLSFVHNGGPQVAATPFHLTYDDNGLITQVREQYLP